jgi:hypothetical protein
MAQSRRTRKQNKRERPGERSDTTQCVACKKAIESSASICPDCGSHQSRWMNTAKFVASIIAVLGAVAAVPAYLPAAKRTLFPKEHVTLVALDSTHSATLYNDGNKPIFVSHIALAVPPKGASVFNISRVVQPSAFLTQPAEAQNILTPEYGFLSHNGWERLFRGSHRQNFFLSPARGVCFVMTVHLIDSPTYRMVKEYYGADFLDFPATAVVFFRGLESSDMRQQSVPVRAILNNRRAPVCDDVRLNVVFQEERGGHALMIPLPRKQ